MKEEPADSITTRLKNRAAAELRSALDSKIVQPMREWLPGDSWWESITINGQVERNGIHTTETVRVQACHAIKQFAELIFQRRIARVEREALDAFMARVESVKQKGEK